MKKLTAIEFRSDKARSVSVAGDFNDWCGSAKGRFDPGIGQMRQEGFGRWLFPIHGISQGRHEFKYIIDGNWEPGPNRVMHIDERGNLYDPAGGIESVELETPSTIRIRMVPHLGHSELLSHATFSVRPRGAIMSQSIIEGKDGQGDEIVLQCRGIELTECLTLEAHGLLDRAVIRPILLDGLFRTTFVSEKPLGVTTDGPGMVFRVFAPRARKVTLKLYSDPDLHHPLRSVALARDRDGVWEARVGELLWGKYYLYQVDGPHGEGEGFRSDRLWADPWSRATIFHNGPSLILNPADTSKLGFSGWTDQDFRTPDKRDLVIWECSVRDLSSHPSVRIDAKHRGKYLGLIDTIGTGTGIDHALHLGINAVELLPVHEFDDDPPGAYHWGYMSAFYFAPEASYATHPRGAQVAEFKAMVNELHRQGIAVILDVVYNHTGKPDHLMGFDRKYFYRHNHDLSLQNFSGCGNDFKSENPMARRLILESLEYWVCEYHVDGFRFDLSELIDDETLHQVERRLRAIKPDVILIHEPWSFRGTNKGRFRNTSWASWNDDFRNRVKGAALGRCSGHELQQVLRGSVDLWCAHPLESVNYVESHDDYTLTDSLTEQANRDGSRPSPLDVRRNLFCAAAVLLSPGVPMLAQGQEMLRSKRGNGNSYNAGDGVNAVDYTLRDRHREAYAFYRDLIAFRHSREGSVLKRISADMCRNVQVVLCNNHNAVGLFWHERPDEYPDAEPGRQILVLFNPNSHQSVLFQPRLPPGRWFRVVAGGKVVSPNSVFSRHLEVCSGDTGGIPVEVSPLDVQVWVPTA